MRLRYCLMSLCLVSGQLSLICGQTCPDLPAPANGDVSYDNGTSGSHPFGIVANYSCNSGYTLVGESTSICSQSGIWSGNAPICQNCPVLNPVPNGMIVFSSGSSAVRPVGTMASYSCNNGFVFALNSGISPRMCQTNGQWSGSVPTCDVPCPDLNIPSNGDVSYNAGTSGSRPTNTLATYSCLLGYSLVGDTSRNCRSGSWSGIASTCQQCPALTPLVNGVITFSSGSSASQLIGTVAIHSCDTGYSLVGTRTSICQPGQTDGAWSSASPTCELICPNLIVPTNGAVTYSDTTIPRDEGSTVAYSCYTGYVFTGNSSMRTCTSSGWSGSDPLCTATCPDLPTLTNGLISYSPSSALRLEGTMATQSCYVGYALFGETERTCLSDRTWSGGDTTCIASCSMLTLINGMIVYTPMGFPILAGAVATHNCSDGYLLFGEMTRTCMTRPTGGGVWEGDAVVCRAICDDLPNITNAVITYSPSTSPRLMDSVANYTCQLDLPLVGNAQRTCQTDRSWSGTEPYCQRVFFQLRGSVIVGRNSELLISEVGVGDGGLVCRTDHPQCCNNTFTAVWLSPNNTVISSTHGDDDFYVTRSDGYITLNRYSNTTTAAGTYCCIVPVSGGSVEVFCIVFTLSVSAARSHTDVNVVTLSVILTFAAIVIAALVTTLIIITKKLKDARKVFKSHTTQGYQSPDSTYYEDMDVAIGGTSNPTAMELNQCPAYKPTEVKSNEEESIYDD